MNSATSFFATNSATILSLGSLFTAVITAYVLLAQLQRKNPNISITSTPPSTFVYTTDKQVVFEVSTMLYKWVRIENKSESPISIYEFLIEKKDGPAFHSHSGLLVPDMDEYGLEGKVITPVFTLKAYEAFEGYVFFRTVDGELIENEKYKLVAKTPRKAFKTDFIFDPTERDL